MLAVAHAAARPAIAEDAIHFIVGDDLLGHLRHEFEIVRAKRAVIHQSGNSAVLALVALVIHGDPIGMRRRHRRMRRVRIGARDDVHAELAASRDQVTEAVLIAEPLRAIVQRNLRG